MAFAGKARTKKKRMTSHPNPERHDEAWAETKYRENTPGTSVQRKEQRLTSGPVRPGRTPRGHSLRDARRHSIQKKESVRPHQTRQPALAYGTVRNLTPVHLGPIIQRLVGLEIELSIPFYCDSHGISSHNISDPAKALSGHEVASINNFLYGGLKYGKSYGRVTRSYDISADHDASRKTHNKLRKHIARHHIVPALHEKVPPMSNMEYRTTPLEERDPGAERRMRNIAKAIQDHAIKSKELAISGRSAHLPPPVQNHYTGIPTAALSKLLEQDAEGKALLDDMVKALNPKLYYQTTIGSLPSEIPDLFLEAAQEIQEKHVDLFNKRNNRASNQNDTANSESIPKSPRAELLRQAVQCAKRAVEHPDVDAFVASMQEKKPSLVGWLTLVAQSLLAYQLEVSTYRYRKGIDDRIGKWGGTPKNLLPYLPKIAMPKTIEAIPAEIRPDFQGPDKRQWFLVFKHLLEECSPPKNNLVQSIGLVDLTGRQYREKGEDKTVDHHEVFLKNNITPPQWMASLAKGEPLAENHVGSGKELTMDDRQEQQTPSLRLTGEQAIPLEDRATTKKTSFSESKNAEQAAARTLEIWKKAKERRMRSTVMPEYQKVLLFYSRKYQQLNNELQSFIHFRQKLTTFDQAGPRISHLIEDFQGLPPAIQLQTLPPSPEDLRRNVETISRIYTNFANWRTADRDNGLALGLFRNLINQDTWFSHKKVLFSKPRVPDAVLSLRAIVNSAKPARSILKDLQKAGMTGLKANDGTSHVNNMIYRLLVDAPECIGSPEGWQRFSTLYELADDSF